MNTETPIAVAEDDPPEETPTAERRSAPAQALLKINTISRKTGLLIAIGLCVCFALKMLFEVNAGWKLGVQRVAHQSLATSQLLASQISGALQWRKADVIDRAYSKLASDPVSGLANLVAIHTSQSHIHCNLLLHSIYYFTLFS